MFPHDPLCDRIRASLASLMLANAWHAAVLANSPVAYQAFYQKYSNSPYAKSALKLAAAPKLVPLSQPKQLIAPSSIKLGGLGVSQGGLGTGPASKLRTDKFGNGQIVMLRPRAKNPSSPNGAGKIVELPAGGLKKTGVLQNSKLNGEVIHRDERPVNSFSPIHGEPSRPAYRGPIPERR